MGFSKGKKVPETFSQKKVEEALVAAKVPTPAEQAQNVWINKGWDYLNRTGAYAGKPLDVTEAPGFDAQESIYGNAAALGDRRRVSVPGMAMSNINPNYAAQLASQDAAQRYNVRAQGLTSGIAADQAQRLGMTQNSIENEMTRKARYLQALTGLNKDAEARRAQGGWGKTLLQVGLQGLGAAGGGVGVSKLFRG